jgi:hypothetical protein
MRRYVRELGKSRRHAHDEMYAPVNNQTLMAFA